MNNFEWVAFRKKLKETWENLWQERIDDKFRAEGIANQDYEMLFIEKGTVIFASRDAKTVSFHEILEKWLSSYKLKFKPVDPKIGGWGKFIRTKLRKNCQSKRTNPNKSRSKKKLHFKKNGYGWLNVE